MLVLMATTVRVSESTRARAADLASASGTTIGQVVDAALDSYEAAQFWAQVRAALSRYGPPDTDEAWDRTLRDGLEE